MTKLLIVCLGVALSLPVTEPFTPAEHLGDPAARSFFVFSTSAGNYIIRHDGMGEVSYPRGLRRAFYLRVARKSRLERVSFLEHEGDLLLLYEVRNHGSFLVRMEQRKRKLRWSTSLGNVSDQPAVVDGNLVLVGNAIEISKANGLILKQD